jgi:hypothetical protein
MTLTREQILSRKVGTATYPHQMGDDVVLIRGLSRNESLEVRYLVDDQGDRKAADNLIIHYGLVEPALSVEDVELWGSQDAAGELTRLSNHIAEVSGLVEGAGKSGVPRARKRS